MTTILDPTGKPAVATLDPELQVLMRKLESYDAGSDPDSRLRYAFAITIALGSRMPPLELIQALLMAACWFADQHHVSRENLQRIFNGFRLPADGYLEYKPGSGGV